MKKISIVIPTYNEGKLIEETVRGIQNTLSKERDNFEIIIIDDSTDETYDIINKLNRKDEVRAIHRGKIEKGRVEVGLALREGFRISKGKVVIPMMADLSEDPKDIKKMVKKIEEGYDVVFGSRFIRGGSVENYPLIKYIANRTYNYLVRLMFLLPYTDITNAFKAYKKEVLDSIELRSIGFPILIELPLKVCLKGYKIAEVPVSWRSRKSGRSKFNLFKTGLDYIKTALKIKIGIM